MREFAIPASLFLALVFAAAAPPPGTTPAVQPKGNPPLLLGTLVHGEQMTLLYSRGELLTTSIDDGEQIASEYGNPPAVLHFSWTCNGDPITLDVRQQAGESGAKFAERAAKLKEDVQAVFPPDPPPHN